MRNDFTIVKESSESLGKNEKVCWAFLGVRTIDYINVSSFIPVEIILTGDYGKEVNFFKKKKSIFSLEKQKKPLVRRDWEIECFDNCCSAELRKRVTNCISKKIQQKRKVYFLCFGTPRFLEEIQDQLGSQMAILSPPSRLRAIFSDKLLQYNSFRELRLPLPLTEMISLKHQDYSRLAKKFGKKFVVHLPHGDQGSGTFFCNCSDDFLEVRNLFSNLQADISSFVDGSSFNMHAVIIDFQNTVEVIPSQPSLQIVGVKGLSRRDTIWSGNDFSSIADILNKSAIEEMARQIKAIGKWMGSLGWRGIFGVDFVRDNSGVFFPLDINARFQGSTQVLVEGCLKEGLIPITVLHVWQFIKHPISSSFLDQMKEQLHIPISGSLLVPHNLCTHRQKIRKVISPGVYSVEKGNVSFERKGYKLSDCRADCTEFVITSGTPAKGSYIEIDCPIFEAQTWNRIAEPSGKELNAVGKSILDYISSIVYG